MSLYIVCKTSHFYFSATKADVGAIVGGVIGALVVVVVIIVIIFFVLRRRRQQKGPETCKSVWR